MSFIKSLFGKSKQGKGEISVKKAARDDPNRKSMGTVLRQPDGATPITKEKERAELTALEIVEQRDWKVKTLPVWQPGDVILDTYEVEDVISGGMGHVYIANHKSWNVKLAIKSPNEMMLSDKSNFARILREANSWTELGLHPNIAYCYYVRNIEDVPHIFVEYVDGGNLRQWIEEGKCIDYRTSLDLAIQFCHGMEHAHSKGMIHRDIKPENVLMTKDGILKITDFGLVRGDGSAAGLSGKREGGTQQPQGAGLTTVGTLMGTAGYMAPEQAERAHEVDERADMFSFGICLYEMFCGNRPYEITFGPRQDPPDPVSLSGDTNFPSNIGAVLTKSVQWEPSERYKNFREIKQELLHIYQLLFGEDSPYAELELLDLEADGLNNQGVSYFDLDRKEKAIASWESALEINRLHTEATYNLSLVLWRYGKIADDEVLRRLDNCASNPAVDKEKLAELKSYIHAERFDPAAAKDVLKKFTGKYDQLFSGKNTAQIKPVRIIKRPTPFASVAITNDGKFAVSGGDDKTVRLWELSSGNCIHILKSHKWYVKSVAISPDGRHIVSGSWDKTLRVWALQSGLWLKTLKGHTGGVSSVTISPDGRYIVSGSHDKTVRVWDLTNGRCIRTFEEHTDYVESVALSADGRYAVSGSRDGTARVWDFAGSRCVQTLVGHRGRVQSVVFSPDQRYVLSGGLDETMRAWEVASGRCARTFKGHTGGIVSIVFSPDGRYAISGSWDGTVRIWEVASGRCVRTLENHTNNVESVALSHNSRLAVSSGRFTLRVWEIFTDISFSSNLQISGLKGFKELKEEKTILNLALSRAARLYEKGDYSQSYSVFYRAWKDAGFGGNESTDRLHLSHLRKGRITGLDFPFQKSLLAGHAGGILSLVLSPDSRYAISGSHDNTVRVWDLKTGRCIHTFEGHDDTIFSVAVTPDGRFAVSGSADHTLRLWELASGRCVHTLKGHTGTIMSVAVTPDGRFAVSGSDDGALRIWALASGGCCHEMKGHTKCVASIAISPTGQYAVSGSHDHTVRIWDLEGGRCVYTLEGHVNKVVSVAFSPDGRYVLSGSWDKTLRFWELVNGQCIHQLEGHSGWVKPVAITPNGRYALSGNKTMRVWDLENGLCVHILKGQRFGFKRLALSPDGRYAVSASSGGGTTLRIWDLASGLCVGTLEGHTRPVNSVSFSVDGRYVVSASKDKTVRVWELIWDLEFPDPVDWDEGVKPYLEIFLTLRNGKWTEEDFQTLTAELAEKRGYGWVRPEGIRKELEKMTRKWKNEQRGMFAKK